MLNGLLFALRGEAVGIVTLEEGDEAFSDEAAQVKGGGSVVGAHDGAELHGAFGEIGDLKSGGAGVPEFRFAQDAVELLADGLDGKGIIHVEKNSADDFGGGVTPVLKWPFNEVGERNDETAEIPETHDDEGGFDLFDPAPFALDDDGIVNANRLRESDLQTGDDAGEGGARGHADNESGDSGGSEDACADLAGVGERHEHYGERDDDNQDDGDALNDKSLGTNAAGMKVVLNVDGITEDEEA